jgi:hypothetical protein
MDTWDDGADYENYMVFGAVRRPDSSSSGSMSRMALDGLMSDVGLALLPAGARTTRTRPTSPVSIRPRILCERPGSGSAVR